MTTENLYDSIALAENIKIQAKARKIQLKDMYAELGMSKGVLSNLRTGRMIAAVWRASLTTWTAPWTSLWGAPLTPLCSVWS